MAAPLCRRDGTRLTVLAQRANITPQAMGKLVDDLERRGDVTRRPDPDDRRAKLIALTATGVDAVEATLETIARLEQRLELRFGKAKMQQLRGMLQDIIRA